MLDTWHAEATQRAISTPDGEPLVVAGEPLPLVWRRHYVAALLPDASETRTADLEDLGFEVVRFADPATWDAAFRRLATLLGRPL